MKKIKLLLPLFILIFSCEDDSDERRFDGFGTDNIQDVNITLQPNLPAYLGDGETIDFNATLPNVFDVASTVFVEFQSQNDAVRLSLSSVEFKANETDNLGDIILPEEDGFTTGNFEGGFGILKVTAFNADDGKGVRYVGKSEPINITIYDNVPSIDEENLSILMDWVSPTTIDLDIKLLDSSDVEVGAAGSGSRYESLSLPNTVVDGEYSIEVTVFATDLTDIPYKFFFIDSNGNKTLLEGSFTAVSADDVLSEVITITKTGDTYTYVIN